MKIADPYRKAHRTMPRCVALLTTGNQCRREAQEGVNCTICHNKIRQREETAGPILPGGCCRIKTTGRRCDRLAEANTTVCSSHRLADERRENERRVQQRFTEQLDQTVAVIVENRDTVAWVDALQMIHLDYRGANISRQMFNALCGRIPAIYEGHDDIAYFPRFNAALLQARILPVEMEEADREAFLQRNLQAPAPPVGELGVLAGDRQNVHTRFVSKQTNEGLDKLLKMTIPADQNTRKSIAKAWMSIYAMKDAYWKPFLDILIDMNIWYETESCRETGDCLYRRALDGAWALIQQTPLETRLQLMKRLYEECRDSYQMCAEGHISRLINVFGGFDDAFKGTVSLNERIQEAMSEISLKSITYEEKLVLAKDLFTKLGVTEQERAPWLEAL